LSFTYFSHNTPSTDIYSLSLHDAFRSKNRTYRYFQGQPLYPFGYGLSYSKFEYGNLKLSKKELDAGDPLGVQVDVKNVSQREGEDRKSTRLNSSHRTISYAVFCLNNNI